MKIKISSVVLYSIILILVYILFNRQSSGYNRFFKPDMIARLGTSTRAVTRPSEPTSRPNVGRGTNNRYFRGGLLSL